MSASKPPAGQGQAKPPAATHTPAPGTGPATGQPAASEVVLPHVPGAAALVNKLISGIDRTSIYLTQSQESPRLILAAMDKGLPIVVGFYLTSRESLMRVHCSYPLAFVQSNGLYYIDEARAVGSALLRAGFAQLKEQKL